MQMADVREKMTQQQVRAWDVLDERVLDVMRQVPREL
ncbi:MAG: protein-L-isoaspartate O-methyltransferase, partial [Gammaproteobacteria bacterium]